MKALKSFVLAIAMGVASTAALADKIVTYTIDPTHTQVYFSWNHVGFSHPGAVFRDISGTITGNHDRPEKSTVEVTIPVASVDSFVPLLNDHLINSGDYFKSKEHPTVTFRSTGIRDIQRKKKTFTLLGDLTVNGITRAVKLQARANTIGPHPFYDNAAAAGFEAITTLRRSDFNMGKYAPVVSDDLAVRITVEAVEADAFRKAQEKKASQ